MTAPVTPDEPSPPTGSQKNDTILTLLRISLSRRVQGCCNQAIIRPFDNVFVCIRSSFPSLIVGRMRGFISIEERKRGGRLSGRKFLAAGKAEEKIGEKYRGGFWPFSGRVQLTGRTSFNDDFISSRYRVIGRGSPVSIHRSARVHTIVCWMYFG